MTSLLILVGLFLIRVLPPCYKNRVLVERGVSCISSSHLLPIVIEFPLTLLDIRFVQQAQYIGSMVNNYATNS